MNLLLSHLQHPQVSLKISKQLQLGIFVSLCQKSSYRKNKENTTYDTKKYPPGAVHFLAGGKRRKTHPSWVYLSSMHGKIFDCGKTNSPCSVLAFARTKPDFGAWAAERQELGQNFLSQAELCEPVCSGKMPFYLFELAAAFCCAGPSPGESPSEEICPNFDENCRVTSLS